MSMRHVVKRRLSQALRLRDLARKERNALRTVDLPLRERAAAWRRGFTSDSGLLYDLSDGRHELYLSDLAHALHTPLINGVSNPTLNDKVLFFHTMRSLGAPTPTVFGLVGPQRTSWLDEQPTAGDAATLLALLEREGELVLKPANGGKGAQVRFVALAGDRLTVNGEQAELGELAGLLVPGTLVCERVRQGVWGDAVFSGAVNTIRLITMWDDEADAPFVALAAHRFGTRRSAPVDNLAQGGLMAGIDVDTGTLGHVRQPYADPAARLTHHPDSGARIEGTAVPRWAEVRRTVLDVSRRLAHIPYVGWDVLVGDEDLWIIEGNNHSDTSFQAFSPLLADARVRRFYARHGVVRSRERGVRRVPAAARLAPHAA
jgi:hypothetical protein